MLKVKKVKVWVTQACLTLCDLVASSSPGPSVHGILQARILAWVAIQLSGGSSWPRDWTQVSSPVVRSVTIWATREAPSEGSERPANRANLSEQCWGSKASIYTLQNRVTENTDVLKILLFGQDSAGTAQLCSTSQQLGGPTRIRNSISEMSSLWWFTPGCWLGVQLWLWVRPLIFPHMVSSHGFVELLLAGPSLCNQILT